MMLRKLPQVRRSGNPAAFPTRGRFATRSSLPTRTRFPTRARQQAVFILIPALLFLFAAAPARAQALTPQDLLRDAALAHQRGDLPAAIVLYRKFLQDCPDAAEVRSNLGAVLAQSARYAEAIQEYAAALEQMPNNPQVRLNLALAYYKLGRFSEAAGALSALHQLQPFEVRPVLLLADCLLQTGQSAKAEELLAPFEQEYPENKAVVYVLGMALFDQNRTAQAQALLNRILSQGESAEAEFLMGQSLHLRQDNLAALDHLEHAVKLNPALPGLHSLYGTVLKSLGQQDRAAEQFQEELKANAFDFMANTQLAVLRRQEGQFNEALDYLERALQVRPNDPGVLFQRASIHINQGLNAQAQGELEQLVKDQPAFAEAHASLATLYYKLKRTADGDRERAAARQAQEDEAAKSAARGAPKKP